MTRHVLDHGGPAQSPRAVRTFLEIDRFRSRDGISRVVARLDRTEKTRGGSRLPAFLRIARGWRA